MNKDSLTNPFTVRIGAEASREVGLPPRANAMPLTTIKARCGPQADKSMTHIGTAATSR